MTDVILGGAVALLMLAIVEIVWPRKDKS